MREREGLGVGAVVDRAVVVEVVVVVCALSVGTDEVGTASSAVISLISAILQLTKTGRVDTRSFSLILNSYRICELLLVRFELFSGFCLKLFCGVQVVVFVI